MAIRVRAKARGFYDKNLREVGSVFSVRSEAELGTWMERLEDAAPAPEKPMPDKPAASGTPKKGGARHDEAVI